MPIILATWEAEIWRISSPDRENSSQDPISKITRAKINWSCGSNHRAPTLQVQSPKLKSQFPPEKRKEKKRNW
jgi:hypothetical protein